VAHSSPQPTSHQPTRHQIDKISRLRNPLTEDLTTTLEVISLAGLLSGILDLTTTSTLA
jgi:hypothetical protein